MILNYLSNSQLIAYINNYNMLIRNSEGTSKLNNIEFREQCIRELNGRLTDCNR